MRKSASIVTTLLVLVSLALASCATTSTSTSTTPVIPATSAATSVAPTGTAAGPQMVHNSAGKLVEKPKYGGTFVRVAASDPVYWDENSMNGPPVWSIIPTNEPLLIGDWTKGPEGTGELGWLYFVSPSPTNMTGLLAESWQIVDDQTIQLKIRHGVHFFNKPPTNGREMNANDVVYSFTRLAQNPKSFAGGNAPMGRGLASITAPDNWTVVFKAMPGQLFMIYYTYLCQGGLIVPHEVIDQYGSMLDWKNNCGTGPLMVSDFVSGSSITYVKNPNYWAKDPLLPDNTLPYVDELKVLIIQDRSTQLAAFRTGKADQMTDLTIEDKHEFDLTNPQMKWAKYLPIASALNWRVDKTPFNDLRVRQALSIAVDRQAITKSLYGGDAEVQVTGAYPIPEIKDYYTPLDQLSQAAKDVYAYDPAKAKALLSDAGYPNGFKTDVVCASTASADIDMLSVVKSYWSAVGVDLDIRQLEPAVLNNVTTSRAYNIVMSAPSPYRPESFTAFTKGQEVNRSMVDDPVVNQAAVDSIATFLTDRPKNIALVKSTLIHIIEQCYQFCPPVPYNYVGWQPWIKGYGGELGVGGRGQQYNYTKYLWIDQDLKKSMGH